MIIYVVQPGDNIYSIAESHGVSAERLILENEISNPNYLVIGQTVVILFPAQTYVVQEDDTLYSIAAAHNVSVMQLLRNNAYLADREYIYPGETLVISYVYEKARQISTNGYAFPFIERHELRKVLPYLTYLTIFNYTVTAEGEINDIDDVELIQIAKEYGVPSIMIISLLTQAGQPDIDAFHSIIISEEIQNRLINNVLSNMKAKGYYGLNVDFQNIMPENRQLYNAFIQKLSTRLHEEGFVLNITITQSTFINESGIMYRGNDYVSLGSDTDSIMLLSYEWGSRLGYPPGVIPVASVRSLLDFGITQVPPEKICIGVPNIGYIWQLPYIEGVTRANAISYSYALELARETGSVIQYDELSAAPFFYCSDICEFIVWFKDARSINTLVGLVPEYGFEGIGCWNIMQFFSQLWLVVNSQYEIEKIPEFGS
ncbi:MAG TPA: LysM peptidoglycan-binding domain-containing protein [Mobilitalea sp.]|nr:LysM peptidoglycan-binding domain-containing protein [Mobilitalea sp.]